MLSCEFCEIFLEHLFYRTTVSEYNLITLFGMIKLFGMAELFRQTKFSVWSNYLIWSNYSIWSHYSFWSNYSIKLPNLFKVVFIWEKRSRVQPGKPSASVSWDDFYFRLHEKFRPRFAGVKMSRSIVLSLTQFDFSYSSAIITLNSSVFILGLTASKSNPIKTIRDF